MALTGTERHRLTATTGLAALGLEALTSAFPVLLPWTVELCLVTLAVVTAVSTSARALHADLKR